MSLLIQTFSREHIEPVVDFNKRIKAGGFSSQFPESPFEEQRGESKEPYLKSEYFLALEKQNVRGAFILKHQCFKIRDQLKSVADYQLPLSEGIVDKSYNLVGLRLLSNALEKQPLLFALGMGGLQEPLPRMLKSMRWSLFSVPFYFRVINSRAFFCNIQYMRKTVFHSFALNFLGISGLGRLALLSKQPLRLARSESPSFRAERIESFDSWADSIWEEASEAYSFIAKRDALELNKIHSLENKNLIRLQILQEGRAVGWLVLLATEMKAHNYFGDMKVGTIVDCLALPGFEKQTLQLATTVLVEEEGVDLIVSNQASEIWGRSLRNIGFAEGPSNYALALSRKLAKLLQPLEEHRANFHINRGDGDGPIHL